MGRRWWRADYSPRVAAASASRCAMSRRARTRPRVGFIEEVRLESPAETAGFESGDLIVEFDGERVRSARQLTRLVQETPAGRSVPATVVRDESHASLSVAPARGTRRSARSITEFAISPILAAPGLRSRRALFRLRFHAAAGSARCERRRDERPARRLLCRGRRGSAGHERAGRLGRCRRRPSGG